MFARPAPPKSLLQLVLRLFSISAWCLRMAAFILSQYSRSVVGDLKLSLNKGLWSGFLDLILFFFFVAVTGLPWVRDSQNPGAWWLLRLDAQLLST